MSEVCELSEGARFIAKDSTSQAVLGRVNFAQSRLCDIQNSINTIAFNLQKYCPSEETASSSSESSSSSTCVPECPPDIQEILYQIKEEDLDAEILSALASLEQNSCDLFRRLKAFGDLSKDTCIPSSSNSSSSEAPPSSSSSSEPPSSSSSSEPPSSSSSSEPPSNSSVEPPPCCRELIYLFADCPELGLDEGLFLYNIAEGEEPCLYVIYEIAFPESSSSSSSSSSSDSSSSGSSYLPGYSYEHNGALNRWELYYNGSLIAISATVIDGCDPYQVLEVLTGPCAGTFIVIE